MFGRQPGDPEFPYQCGYSAGYRLVRTWLDSTGNTASTAVGVGESDVIRAWLDGAIKPFE